MESGDISNSPLSPSRKIFDARTSVSSDHLAECIGNLEETFDSLSNITPGVHVNFRGHKFELQSEGMGFGISFDLFWSGETSMDQLNHFENAVQEIQREIDTITEYCHEEKERGKVMALLGRLEKITSRYFDSTHGDQILDRYAESLKTEIVEHWDGFTFMANKIVSEDDIAKWKEDFEKGILTKELIEEEPVQKRREVMTKILLTGTEKKEGLISQITKEVHRIIDMNLDFHESWISSLKDQIEEMESRSDEVDTKIEKIQEEFSDDDVESSIKGGGPLVVDVRSEEIFSYVDRMEEVKKQIGSNLSEIANLDQKRKSILKNIENTEQKISRFKEREGGVDAFQRDLVFLKESLSEVTDTMAKKVEANRKQFIIFNELNAKLDELS